MFFSEGFGELRTNDIRDAEIIHDTGLSVVVRTLMRSGSTVILKFPRIEEFDERYLKRAKRRLRNELGAMRLLSRIPGVLRLHPGAATLSNSSSAAGVLAFERLHTAWRAHRAAGRVNRPSLMFPSSNPAYLDDCPWAIAMEDLGNHCIDAFDLMVSHKGKLPVHMVKCIIRSVVSTLARMHAIGVFHMDVKAENVLIPNVDELSKPGSRDPVLADFDSAVRRWPPSLRLPVKRLGHAVTEFYAPPESEAMRSSPTACGPYDMWGVGQMICVLAFGRFAFGEAGRTCFTADGAPRLSVVGVATMTREKVGALDLAVKLLHRDPEKRLRACESLNHYWLQQ